MEEEEKELITISLTKTELRKMASFSGLKSENSAKFVLRVFISTVLMNQKSNRVERKTSHFKLNKNTSYDKD